MTPKKETHTISLRGSSIVFFNKSNGNFYASYDFTDKYEAKAEFDAYVADGYEFRFNLEGLRYKAA